MRILVVDDSAAARLMISNAVRELGHECETADDGEAAWEALQDGDFDAVISDWLMPKLEGDALSRRIRAAAGPYVYIILLTSLDDRAHMVRGLEAGADDYLGKPVDREELAARLISAERIIRLYRQLADQSAQLERLNERLHVQARTDPLTGLGNRLRMHEDLDAAEGRAERYGRSYAVALCDIDRFKAYNDAFGHGAGDDVLRRVAETIRARLRRGDHAYRYGGEEILLLFPEQDLGRAAAAAERARGAVEGLGIDHPGAADAGVVTISAGVAARDSAGGGVDAVLRLADEALYAAKRAGRNGVATAPARE